MHPIVAKSVCFSFEKERVLDEIDVHCLAGEFVSILGPSGCGKSTLLRLLAGLLRPSSGEISVPSDDSRVASATQVRRASFVFQHPTLCPWLTVAGNVELPLRLQGVSKSERRQAAKEAIRLVDLDETAAGKRPNQLSGGMQMRVSLARALVTRPTITFLDEPFSALDEVLRQQLCETCLHLWQRESWTTIFVTHNVAEAVFMSQRIYILAGRPAQVVDVIAVPFQVRNRDLRVTAEFNHYVSDVSKRLRDAVERHGGGQSKP